MGGITANKGWLGTILWNSAGGATSAAVNGDNPVSGAIGGAAGSSSGKVTENIIGPVGSTLFGEYVSDKTKDLYEKILKNKNKDKE